MSPNGTTLCYDSFTRHHHQIETLISLSVPFLSILEYTGGMQPGLYLVVVYNVLVYIVDRAQYIYMLPPRAVWKQRHGGWNKTLHGKETNA